MSSEALTHAELLPAYGEPRLAYGESPADVVEAADVEEFFDRGKDWPLTFANLTPVIVAYAAIGYGLYVAANALS